MLLPCNFYLVAVVFSLFILQIIFQNHGMCFGEFLKSIFSYAIQIYNYNFMPYEKIVLICFPTMDVKIHTIYLMSNIS